jgi:hypothetical protein
LKNCFYPLQLITKSSSKTQNKRASVYKVGIILMVLSKSLAFELTGQKKGNKLELIWAATQDER